MSAQAGTCRFCGCSEDRACPGGCSWADKARTVCSRCDERLRRMLRDPKLRRIVRSLLSGGTTIKVVKREGGGEG
jgi:hypothetical protein